MGQESGHAELWLLLQSHKASIQVSSEDPAGKNPLSISFLWPLEEFTSFWVVELRDVDRKPHSVSYCIGLHNIIPSFIKVRKESTSKVSYNLFYSNYRSSILLCLLHSTSTNKILDQSTFKKKLLEKGMNYQEEGIIRGLKVSQLQFSFSPPLSKITIFTSMNIWIIFSEIVVHPKAFILKYTVKVIKVFWKF